MFWYRGSFSGASPELSWKRGSEEYLRVIEEISLLKTPHLEHRWEAILAEKCRLIPDAEPNVVLLRDPSDAKLVDCATRSGADYLVSGDQDLKSYKGEMGFRIVSPRQFLKLL